MLDLAQLKLDGTTNNVLGSGIYKELTTTIVALAGFVGLIRE